MGAQVSGDGEVAVERRRAQRVLEPGEVWRLPSDQGQGPLSQGVAPFWQRAFVWREAHGVSNSGRSSAAAGARARGRQVRRRTVVQTPQSGIDDGRRLGPLVVVHDGGNFHPRRGRGRRCGLGAHGDAVGVRRSHWAVRMRVRCGSAEVGGGRDVFNARALERRPTASIPPSLAARAFRVSQPRRTKEPARRATVAVRLLLVEPGRMGRMCRRRQCFE